MRVSLLIVFTFLLILVGASGCATWSAEKKYPPIGTFVETNPARMHVVDIGPRESALPPVILIHGASVNLRDMKMALGDELAKTRRVIMVDRPGRGYSSRPDNGYELAAQARLIKSVADDLGLERPVVVGQSFGGAVALAYSLQYQDEMHGLVLLAAVSHEWPGGIAWYNKVSQWPVLGVAFRRLVIPVYGQLSAEDGIKESFAPDEAPANYFDRAGLPLLFRASDFKANAQDLANLKRQIIAQQSRYSEIKLPVAIITGDADTTVSPKIHSRQLAEDIQGADLTILPDTGHALHHAETDRIIDLIDEISQR
ncbi:alpha/beta fold hydrolase [Hyphococcus sp. DH-69]|uniref:alpha/beta fold hydrolase n=1 Tax=Hyphococcus formosus TaxID=3143534 RepID=UPI00398B0549